MNIEKIVVGMDFSDAAIAAATWLHEAFAPDARLIFVHALEPDRDRFLPQATYATSLEPRFSLVDGAGRTSSRSEWWWAWMRRPSPRGFLPGRSMRATL